MLVRAWSPAVRCRFFHLAVDVALSRHGFERHREAGTFRAAVGWAVWTFAPEATIGGGRRTATTKIPTIASVTDANATAIQRTATRNSPSYLSVDEMRSNHSVRVCVESGAADNTPRRST